MIEIWTPRYHDNTVLIASYKVAPGLNKIKFTRAKHLAGKIFSVMGVDVFKCPLQSNGRISCYVVPMEMLHLCKEISSTTPL